MEQVMVTVKDKKDTLNLLYLIEKVKSMQRQTDRQLSKTNINNEYIFKLLGASLIKPLTHL